MFHRLTGRFGDGVFAGFSDRLGGASTGAYAGFNLGGHVGDGALEVGGNRAALEAALPEGTRPCWLRQVHGRRTVTLPVPEAEPEADAAVSRDPGSACIVLTADCLPVLLRSAAGDCVAAVHAGWRGLAAGVLESALDVLAGPPGGIQAWLGPAIGADAFEVGPEVRQRFLETQPSARHAELCFRPARGGRFLCDLRALAVQRLEARGVHDIDGDARCTYDDSEHFYSYRRDGTTGRMAFLICPLA